MGRKSITGLYQRDGTWHVDKQVKGYGRICESTGSSDRQQAEQYLIHKLDQIRQTLIFGVKPCYSFRQAATKYLNDNRNMPSIVDTAMHFKQLDPYIGDMALERIHDDTLKSFIAARSKSGVSNRTINLALQRVVRVLRLAAHKWRDASGQNWLDKSPSITMLDEDDSRAPYPLSWEEQRYLMQALPAHLQPMALYKLNVGCREQEVCRLRWEYEVDVPEAQCSVFVIPRNFGGRRRGSGVKNKLVRLVVLNKVAQSVIERQRGKHPEWVFPYTNPVTKRTGPLAKMNDSAWKAARKRAAQAWQNDKNEPAPAGFARVRVHDLKHTFGRRLRAADVLLEDRKVLLGHKLRDVTEHYSAAEIASLLEKANRVITPAGKSSPTLVMLQARAA